MRWPTVAPIAAPAMAPATATVRGLPDWLPMIAPTIAPAAAPAPAPCLVFWLGSFVAQATASSTARRRIDALRIMSEPPVASLYAKRAPRCRAPFRIALTCLRLVRADVDLDAPVQLAAVGGAVRRPRSRFTEADGVDARVAHAEVLDVIGHRVGAAFGKALVVGGRAGRVGVTLHGDGRVRVLLEDVGHIAKRGTRCRTESRRVVVEEDVVPDGHIQFVVRGASYGDAGNLAKLTLLLVHHRADDCACCCAGQAADDGAALSGMAVTIVADDAARDRAGDAADDRAFFCLRMIVGCLGKGGRSDQKDG